MLGSLDCRSETLSAAPILRGTQREPESSAHDWFRLRWHRNTLQNPSCAVIGRAARRERRFCGNVNLSATRGAPVEGGLSRDLTFLAHRMQHAITICTGANPAENRWSAGTSGTVACSGRTARDSWAYRLSTSYASAADASARKSTPLLGRAWSR